MTRICHITSAHNTDDIRVFKKECISLAKHGYEVFLIGKGESRVEEGVNVIGFGKESTSRLKRILFDSKRAYKKALEINADIYHFHDPELIPYGVKLKRRGKRVIFDSHENTAESIMHKEWIPKSARKLVYAVYSRYQKSRCQHFDAVIIVTPNCYDYFSELNNRVVTVTNYPIFREDVAIPSFTEKRIGFAGGIDRQWNHHTILAALVELPQVEYSLCGKCDEGYLSELKASPAWDQVHYYGVIPHLEVSNVLSECSIGMALLQPSGNTSWNVGTLGNTKIFEEMMAGLPVICTNFELWEKIIGEYQCGLCIAPDNKDQIVTAIRYLMENPEVAKKMGENGRRAIREKYSWATQERELLKLYKEII